MRKVNKRIKKKISLTFFHGNLISRSTAFLPAVTSDQAGFSALALMVSLLILLLLVQNDYKI
jgi:hypothetical protein